MNELRLKALHCPQCSAPGAVREGTRITRCERCGVGLFVDAGVAARYEVRTELDAAAAAAVARDWLAARRIPGAIGRPELLLIPFHEIAGRRIGVFERKVPHRRRVEQVRRSMSESPEIDIRWVQEEIEDTKILLSDVQWLTAAARAPWPLDRFDAGEARRSARLARFDLVDAQRRATVFAAAADPAEIAERRFGGSVSSEIVALGRHTLYFPFWSVPITHDGGSYEIVVDGTLGRIIAARLPQPHRRVLWLWAALATPGTAALGAGLRAAALGTGPADPLPLLALGGALTGAALWWSRRARRPGRLDPPPPAARRAVSAAEAPG